MEYAPLVVAFSSSMVLIIIVFLLQGRKKVTVASVMSQISHVSDDTCSVSSMSLESEAQPTNQMEDVLVVTLGNDLDCPGMMSEQKVCSKFIFSLPMQRR